ncbi:MAG: PRC-barrel domain-containing protein [Synechococcales bacterium]|nr:PRC-barrel domain-containing protein [Cyanobacteria bacterium REEB444]MEB3125771.1 PRC-barrel domain-containing protein [Synechococcales bacterium]
MVQPDGIRQSILLNQLVLDRASLDELGRIELLWMYPTQHRVLGFICRSGLLSAKKLAFNLPQIKTLGDNGILVQSNPVETDAEKVKQLESLLNCEVWADDGHKVGKIVDYFFNLKTGAITAYLLLINGITGVTGSLYLLPPGNILNFGRSRILVSQSNLKALEIYQESWKIKLDKFGEVVKDDYTELVQGWRSLTQQVKHQGEETRNRVQTWSSQLKDKASAVQDYAQTWMERVKEQTHEQAKNWDEQLRDGMEQITQQADSETRQFSETLQRQSRIMKKRVHQEGRHAWEQIREFGEVLLDTDRDMDFTVTIPSQPMNVQKSDPLEDWTDLEWEKQLEDDWDIESPPNDSLPTIPNPFASDLPQYVSEKVQCESEEEIAPIQDPLIESHQPNQSDEGTKSTVDPTEETPMSTAGSSTFPGLEPQIMDNDDDDPWI